MVNEKVLIRDKYRVIKKISKIFLIIFLVLFVLFGVFVAGVLLNNNFSKNKEGGQIILENPLKNIVLKYSNVSQENPDSIQITPEQKNSIIEEAILDFNQEYINYILLALGVNYLHKSVLMENPFIELVLDEEVWNSEIIEGIPNSKQGEIENEDLRITMSKRIAVEALLSSNMEEYFKNSVLNGDIQLEMVANEAELFSKGYLDMYNALKRE